MWVTYPALAVAQERSVGGQQDRRGRQESPRVQLPSGFHRVSQGEQAAMLMNVISGAPRVCKSCDFIPLTGLKWESHTLCVQPYRQHAERGLNHPALCTMTIRIFEQHR